MIEDSQCNYFTLSYAIKEHEFIIKKSGGLRGVKDKGAIESILFHVKNDEYYPDFLDKITHIVFSLNKSHAFNDGNKRASIALSAFFLELNDHSPLVKTYTEGMEEVAIWIAKSFINKDLLKDIIAFLLYDNSLNIYYFIEQAQRYREYIEEENSRIGSELLCLMVNEWIGNESLDEQGKLRLLEAIS